MTDDNEEEVTHMSQQLGRDGNRRQYFRSFSEMQNVNNLC
jgi:hypothetical protein